MAETVSENEILSASMEDYLEAIFNLSGQNKVARSRDIAGELDVSPASVTGALKFLSQRGLVDYEPYGYIRLTEKGRKEAATIVRRHNIIESFLVNVLGVDRKTAKRAACKAEHALGAKVARRLMQFMDFVEDYEKKGQSLASQFEEFCKGVSGNRHIKGKNQGL